MSWWFQKKRSPSESAWWAATKSCLASIVALLICLRANWAFSVEGNRRDFGAHMEAVFRFGLYQMGASLYALILYVMDGRLSENPTRAWALGLLIAGAFAWATYVVF